MEGRRRLSLCSNNCRMSYWNSQRKPNGWQDHLYANAEQVTPSPAQQLFWNNWSLHYRKAVSFQSDAAFSRKLNIPYECLMPTSMSPVRLNSHAFNWVGQRLPLAATDRQGRRTLAWSAWRSCLPLWIVSKWQKEAGTVWNSFQEVPPWCQQQNPMAKGVPGWVWQRQSWERGPSQALPAAWLWLWFLLLNLPAFLPVHSEQ